MRCSGSLAAFCLLLLGTPLPVSGEVPEPGSAGFDPPIGLIEVDLHSPDALRRLAPLDLDFVLVRPGFRANILAWPGAEDELRAAELDFRRVTDDYGAELVRGRELGRRPPSRPSRPGRATAAGWNVPPFGQGSLAGFWTMDEVYALLDSLSATDTRNIVTDVDTIGTSLQGRPILALGVTDLSAPLGTRPEVLFTSLHHAREPTGMQSVLLFLTRLVADYGTNPELTYLVKEREIWFVPIVNPDGYVRNENTWFNTGSFGFWRKNLRDNDGNTVIDSQDGVDLNRNYGYQWGVDDTGSSPHPNSPTYRGTGPFSEPETRVIRDFCNAHDFKTANNYHAYWEAVLYPWGFMSSSTPDVDAFVRLADAMVAESRYSYGHSDQIIYLVNGEANDWMYGEQASKPKILAYTSEVGRQDDGFWPAPSRILPLAKLNLASNIVLAYGAGAFLRADSLEVGGGTIVPGEIKQAVLHLRNIGLSGSTTGGVTVTMSSDDPGLVVLQDQITFPDLGPEEDAWPDPGRRLVLHASPSIPNGTRVTLPLVLTDGEGYVGADTLALRVGDGVVVFADGADTGLGSWIANGTWGTENVDGDLVFSDSPGDDYGAFVDASLALGYGLDLSGAVNAVLRFRTQWDIETGYDFGRVEASVDSGKTWMALDGDLTRPGHGYALGAQPLGVPGYDGNKRFWESEEMDLSAYAGARDVRLRFRLTSDGGQHQEGWWIDDLNVLAYPVSAPVTAQSDLPAHPVPLLTAAPNPVEGSARIVYSLPRAAPVRVSVYDVAGREVKVLSEGYAGVGAKTLVWDGLGSAGVPVPAGTYFVHLKTSEASTAARLLVIR